MAQTAKTPDKAGPVWSGSGSAYLAGHPRNLNRHMRDTEGLAGIAEKLDSRNLGLAVVEIQTNAAGGIAHRADPRDGRPFHRRVAVRQGGQDGAMARIGDRLLRGLGGQPERGLQVVPIQKGTSTAAHGDRQACGVVRGDCRGKIVGGYGNLQSGCGGRASWVLSAPSGLSLCGAPSQYGRCPAGLRWRSLTSAAIGLSCLWCRHLPNRARNLWITLVVLAP